MWTDQAIQTMRSCAAERKSATQTAAVLGTTRNAVLGKAHHLGVRFDGELPPAKPRKVPRAQPVCAAKPAVRPERHEARNDAIVRMYANGNSARVVAEAFGLCTLSVGTIVRARGVRRRENQRPRFVFDHKTKVAAVAAVLAGVSYAKAARAYGCSTQSIKKSWMRDLSVVADAKPLALAAHKDALQRKERREAEARGLIRCAGQVRVQ